MPDTVVAEQRAGLLRCMHITGWDMNKWEQMDFDIDDNTSRFKPYINPPLYESIPDKLLVHLNLKETLVSGLWKPRCQERAPQLSIESRGVYELG
jgi:hypothetical protein